jgi:hypothetical protein
LWIEAKQKPLSPLLLRDSLPHAGERTTPNQRRRGAASQE